MTFLLVIICIEVVKRKMDGNARFNVLVEGSDVRDYTCQIRETCHLVRLREGDGNAVDLG
jgi:hypothetical protein